MSDLIQQGLWISGVGFGLLFVFMGLIMLMMIVLERLTRSSTPASRTAIHDGSVAGPGENEEVAAAIAVAIAHLRAQERSRSNLGSTLETGHGHWWLTGRSQQNPSSPARTLRREG